MFRQGVVDYEWLTMFDDYCVGSRRGFVQLRQIARSDPRAFNTKSDHVFLRAAAGGSADEGSAGVFNRASGQAAHFGRSALAAHLENTLFAECATNAVFGAAVFRDPANTNDIYLHTFHTPFVISSVYRGGDGGLPFIATFHLHLVADGSNTIVGVTASDTEVVNGTKFGIGPCGPGMA